MKIIQRWEMKTLHKKLFCFVCQFVLFSTIHTRYIYSRKFVIVKMSIFLSFWKYRLNLFKSRFFYDVNEHTYDNSIPTKNNIDASVSDCVNPIFFIFLKVGRQSSFNQNYWCQTNTDYFFFHIWCHYLDATVIFQRNIN